MGFRVDWQKIRARYGSVEEATEPFLFCLPDGGRDLLLAIMQFFQWQATYRVSDYDFGDWDELQQIVSQTVSGLTESVELSKLQEMLEMDVNVTVNSGSDCGCSQPVMVECVTTVDLPVEYTPPDETIDRQGDPPFDYPTFEAFDESACNAANFIASRPYVLLQQMDSYIGEQVTTLTLTSLVGGVWGLLAGSGASAAAGSGAVGLAITSILGIVNDGLGLTGLATAFRDVADAYEADLMDEVVCLLYESRDTYQVPPDLQNVVNAWLASRGYDSPLETFLRNLLFQAFDPPLWLSLLVGQLTTPPSNYVDCAACNSADYFFDFGSLDDEWSNRYVPDGTGRVLQGERAVNFAANSTFPTTTLTSGSVEIASVSSPVTSVVISAQRWESSGSELNRRDVQVRFRDSGGSVIEVQTLVSFEESLAMQRATTQTPANEDDTLWPTYTATFSMAQAPATYEIIVREAGEGGNVQIQVGAIWIYT